MSLTLVTVRARTRGKGPQEFTYQGVGKLTPRTVLDKDGNPIRKDGKPLEYVDKTEEKDGKTVTEKVLAEGQEFVTVDDIDAAGITSELKDVLELFGQVKSEQTPLQRVIDGALNYYNLLARNEAAPVSEVAPKDPELTALVSELVKAGIMSEEKASNWRRVVTQAATQLEMTTVAYAEMTKEVKALRAAAK